MLVKTNCSHLDILISNLKNIHSKLEERIKVKKQIDNLPCGYMVKDDIEIGHGNIVHLWMLGFNYYV